MFDFLSKIQKYTGAGEQTNPEIVEQYGEPAKRLFTSLNSTSLHQEVTITDEQDNVLYRTSSSIFTLKAKTEITDAAGNPVAHIEKRPVSIHEKHFITMADGTQLTLSNEVFHVVKDITNIEENGWQLRGNVIGLNFALFDENDEIIAAIGQKLISVHDRYCIDLYQTRHERAVAAIVIALSKMLDARRESESSSSFSFNSDE